MTSVGNIRPMPVSAIIGSPQIPLYTYSTISDTVCIYGLQRSEEQGVLVWKCENLGTPEYGRRSSGWAATTLVSIKTPGRRLQLCARRWMSESISWTWQANMAADWRKAWSPRRWARDART